MTQLDDDMVRCDGCEELFEPDEVVTIGGQQLCADCKEDHLQDVRSGATLDSNELAGLGQRFGAQFLDGLIIGVPMAAIFFGLMFGFLMNDLSQLNNDATLIGAQILFALVGMAVWILYEALMLKSCGQTLGKKALKIKVVTLDDEDLTGKHAFLRALVRSLLSLHNLGSLLDACFIFGQQRRCIHDLAGGTKVIRLD